MRDALALCAWLNRIVKWPWYGISPGKPLCLNKSNIIRYLLQVKTILDEQNMPDERKSCPLTASELSMMARNGFAHSVAHERLYRVVRTRSHSKADGSVVVVQTLKAAKRKKR
jgi:hypothetical protein